MKLYELQKFFKRGSIEKKTYWTLVREGYTHILPEFQKILTENDECRNIMINKDACILEKKNGVKLFFDFTQAMCRAEIEIAMGEDPEKEAMEFVSRYLRNHKCRTVFDIGANVGLFSLDLYMELGHAGITYHAFEPVHATYGRLTATAELNRVNPEFYIMHNIGFSNVKGVCDFYVPAESEAASLRPVDDEFYRKRSTETGEYTGADDIERICCEVSVIDDFVSENSIDDIGFMKIDVEGSEKYVLEGAEKTLRIHKPLVYCELLRKHAKRFGYHPNEVIGYMESLGYHCAVIRDKKLTAVKEINEQTAETNFFFIYSEDVMNLQCT